MRDTIVRLLIDIASIGEIIGAGLLVLGFVVATVRFVIQSRIRSVSSAYQVYRRSLGRALIIGLEVLVAVTIIKTITVEPDVRSLGLLALMVLIRTILSWTVVVELSGRWPWQRSAAQVKEYLEAARS